MRNPVRNTLVGLAFSSAALLPLTGQRAEAVIFDCAPSRSHPDYITTQSDYQIQQPEATQTPSESSGVKPILTGVAFFGVGAAVIYWAARKDSTWDGWDDD